MLPTDKYYARHHILKHCVRKSASVFLSKVKSMRLDSIHVLTIIIHSVTTPIFMTSKSCQPASILEKHHTYFFILCLAQPN